MVKVKLFITGMGGMVGRCLAQYAVNADFVVAGTINKTLPKELKTYIDRTLVKPYSVDLISLKQLKKALLDYNPDVVIHLAGRVLSRSDKKISDPKTYTENITILKNLLSVIKKMAKRPKLILVSGCLVYDKSKSPNPIKEIPVKNLPKVNIEKEPYRASRIEQEKLLVSEKDINYIIVRPTQLTGPGKISGVIEYYIAREIFEVLRNKDKKEVNIGNKLGEVDILDVRDAATALLTLIKKGVNREIYHLSTGSPVNVESVIKTFLETAGIDPNKFKVHSLSKEQITYFRFSPKKLKALGWKPQFSLSDTLTTYFEYFKNQQADI